MKLPKEAKRVFKGVLFDIYQWEQKMFDGTTQTFERAKRPDTTEVIATQGDKILISYEEQPDREPFYTFFGGRSEDGEEPLIGAKRELQEEAGLTSDHWELFKSEQPVGKLDWNVYHFIARDCKKTQSQQLDSGEKIQVKAVSFDEFCKIVLSDDWRDLGFAHDLLKMKCLEPKKLEEFKKKLFG